MDRVNNELIPALQDPNTRQFYCNSHGSPWALGDSWGDVTIDCRDLMFKLGNFIEPSAKVDVVTNPYRFVFLDGCSTLATRSWAYAFGIFDSADDLEGNGVIGPQAFVGYFGDHTSWLSGPSNVLPADRNVCAAIAEAYCATLQNFYLNWMRGDSSVYNCIRSATTPGAPGCYAPLPTPRKRWLIKCVEADKGWIEFIPPGPVGNLPQGVTYVVNEYMPVGSKIYVLGHQGLTRGGLDHEDEEKSGYQYPW